MPPRGNNADQAARNLEAVIKAGAERSEDALHVIGMLITNAVKVNITRAFPPASEPGEPPHLRTGGLRQSYKYSVNKAEGRRVASVSVYSDRATIQPVPEPGRKRPPQPVVYASYLEFGTSKMRARPHLRPAVEQVRPMIPGLIRMSWAAGVQQSARTRRRR